MRCNDISTYDAIKSIFLDGGVESSFVMSRMHLVTWYKSHKNAMMPSTRSVIKRRKDDSNEIGGFSSSPSYGISAQMGTSGEKSIDSTSQFFLSSEGGKNNPWDSKEDQALSSSSPLLIKDLTNYS